MIDYTPSIYMAYLGTQLSLYWYWLLESNW